MNSIGVCVPVVVGFVELWGSAGLERIIRGVEKAI